MSNFNTDFGLIDLSPLMVEKCSKSEIKKHWKPQIGDFVYRKYTVFGEEIDKEIWGEERLFDIVVLTYKSEISGYYHCHTTDGKERLFKSDEEYYEATCVWIPRPDQLIDVFIKKMLEMDKERYGNDKGYDSFEFPFMKEAFAMDFLKHGLWKFNRRHAGIVVEPETYHQALLHIYIEFSDKKVWDIKERNWVKLT